MKAWGIESRQEGTVPKIFEVEKPLVGSGSVLVEVKGSSLNPADIKVMSGKDGAGFLHDSKFPILLGYDFAGMVAQTGAGVTGFAPGQEVYGFLPYAGSTRQGAFSQYVVAKAGEIALKPKSHSFAQAASLSTAACTALQGLRDHGKLKAGQKVFINGASGGVGSMAIQMAKIMGAEVWASASSKNLDYLKSLGADQALDYEATPVERISGAFDLVFDVASNAGFSRCAPKLAPGGVYVALLPSPLLIRGWLRSLFSSKSCRFVIAKSDPANLGLIAQWAEEGKLKPCLDATFSFGEIPQALGALKQKSPRGKIAVSF